MPRATHIQPNATSGRPQRSGYVHHSQILHHSLIDVPCSVFNSSYTFSAKERDLETGYSYFGARYYDAGLSVWLSVDPLSDKYPSMSAYMYCAGNPVMLMDPDGRDWFQNELTGAVYYNSEMTKGQEGTGAMRGDGWVHLGENGMFTNKSDSPDKAERALVKNSGGNDEGTELMLRGKAATDFMSNQGYILLATEQTIYRKTTTVTSIMGSKSVTSTSIEEIRITEKVGYFRKGTKRVDVVLVGGPDGAHFLPGNHVDLTIQETVGRYIIGYERNPIIKAGLAIAKIITIAGGKHENYKIGSPTTYRWSTYPKHIELINKFAEIHGKSR